MPNPNTAPLPNAVSRLLLAFRMPGNQAGVRHFGRKGIGIIVGTVEPGGTQLIAAIALGQRCCRAADRCLGEGRYGGDDAAALGDRG